MSSPDNKTIINQKFPGNSDNSAEVGAFCIFYNSIFQFLHKISIERFSLVRAIFSGEIIA